MFVYPNPIAQQQSAAGGIVFDDLLAQANPHHLRVLSDLQAVILLQYMLDSNFETAQAYYQTLQDLRKAGITSQQLRQQHAATLATLIDILARYEQLLAAYNIVDTADITRETILNVASGGWVLPDNDIHLVLGNDILPDKLDFLNACVAQGAHVQMHMSWDSAQPELFAYASSMLSSLEAYGHLQLYVHMQNPAERVVPEVLQSEHCLTKHTAIVQQIHKWHAAGIAYGDIGIVLADGMYNADLLEACKQAGIPVGNTVAPTLWHTAAARVLLLCMQTSHHGIALCDFVRIWSAWGVPVQTDAASIAPLAYIRLLQKRGIKRIDLHDTHLPQEVCALLQPLLQLEHARTLKDYVTIAMQLLQIQAATDAVIALRNLLDTWLVYSNDLPSKPYDTIHDFLALLKYHCMQTSLHDAVYNNNAVVMLKPDWLPGCRFLRLIVVGMDAGVFPRPVPDEVLLSMPVRRALYDMVGIRLTLMQAKKSKQAWLWSQMLAATQACMVVCRDKSVLLQDCQPITPNITATSISLWSQYRAGVHGMAALPDTLSTSVQTYMSQHVHSTSRIDILGTCMFRFVASYWWQLSADSQTSLSADPQEQGVMAHHALEIVYNDIMQHGGLKQARLLPDATTQRAMLIIDQHKDALLKKTSIHPLLQQSAFITTKRSVMAQLQRDFANKSPTEPVATEYRFGNHAAAPALSFTYQADDYQLPIAISGSIDRIDQDPQGAAWVFDYKRTYTRREASRHFQLAIYSAVIARDMPENSNHIHAAWLTLKDGKAHVAKDLPSDPHVLQQTLQQHISQRLKRLFKLDWSADPEHDQICNTCHFKALCRYV